MPLTSQIQDHNPELNERFKADAAALRDAFGENLLSVHHVGSTPIPGLKAKPEVDFLIVLAKAERLEDHLETMESLGYESDPKGDTPGHWYYQKDTDGRRTHKAHVCTVGNDQIWKMLLFRDYLLDHPERAKAYGKLKLALEQENVAGMMEYIEGKGSFILETLELALKEGREKPRS